MTSLNIRPNATARRRLRRLRSLGRRLVVEALERRDLLAAELISSSSYASPAPTVLPVFSPATAPTLTTPLFESFADHEDEQIPEQGDPWLDGFISQSPLTNDDTFQLHSRPDSNYTIFLDFDGGITEGTAWNNTTGIETLVDIAYDRDGNAASFSDSELNEIRNIWKLVAEDFAPFDVDVTTEDPGVDALRKYGSSDTKWGIRSLHTTNTNQVCSGCGGVAYIGSFTSSIDLPAYSFNKGVGAGGNTQSHEVGHSLRLYHDGLAGGATYYGGHGSGSTSWGPIMGGIGSRSLRTWSNGEYYNASNQQDDLGTITTSSGVSYRPDDHGNTFATSSPLDISATSQVSGFGVIEQNNDIDFFSFWTEAGNVSLDIHPYLAQPNLDVWAAIYDATGSLIVESNPADQLTASFSNVNLAAGMYYLRVEGVGSHGFYNAALDRVFDPGEADYSGPETEVPWSVPSPTGYSDYASVGQYWISGTRAVATSDLISIQSIDSHKKEGDSGSTPFTFQVARSGSIEPELQVGYAVLPAIPDADSTRTLPSIEASDFASGTIPSGLITIPAGSNAADLVIEVAGDTQFERDEFFRVVIFEPTSGWMLSNSSADATILSDETQVGVASANTAIAVQPEGDLNSVATYTFTLRRTGDTTVATTAQWEVQYTGLANPASDLDFVNGVRPSGEVIFNPGVSEITVSIEVAGDLDVEKDESFLVAVSGVSGENSTQVDPALSSQRGIILEDESPATVLDQVQFRWRQVLNSGSSRDPWAIDNVTLSTTEFADDFDPDLDGSQWASIENGAVNATDSIFPGGNGQELLMQGTGDRIATSAATKPGPGATLNFDLIIGNGTGNGGNGADNAEAGKDVWLEYSVDGLHWEVLRKLDTDDYETWKTVSVSLPDRAIVSEASLSEGDTGTNSMSFSIVRSGNLGKTASLSWQLVPAGTYPIDEMDLEGSTLPLGTVQFGIGDDLKTISIPIQGDTNLEPDETFDLIVTDYNAGPVTGGSRRASVLNDDAPTVESVVINDGSVQRSAIRQIQIQFGGLVDAQAAAFSLTNLGTDTAPANVPVENLIVTISDEGTNTKVQLGLPGDASLPDGNYRLDIQGSQISARFGGFTMGADYSFGDEAVDGFYRKYGDLSGNRTVDLVDFADFRRSFGLLQGQLGYRDELDSDDDNAIGLVDFAAFRRNFGT